jgi:hypothetical protein
MGLGSDVFVFVCICLFYRSQGVGPDHAQQNQKMTGQKKERIERVRKTLCAARKVTMGHQND